MERSARLLRKKRTDLLGVYSTVHGIKMHGSINDPASQTSDLSITQHHHNICPVQPITIQTSKSHHH